MSTTYKVGDIVVLKSGGPEMTVQVEPKGDSKFNVKTSQNRVGPTQPIEYKVHWDEFSPE